MKNIAFVIWMIGWPLAYHLEKWMNHIYSPKKQSSESTETIVALIDLIIWIVVAMNLWEAIP